MSESELSNGHTFRQEEARMLALLYKAQATGNQWRDYALCGALVEAGEADPDDWFAPDGTEPAQRATEDCFTCPVRKECLSWACDSKQKEGIWGGQPRTLRIQKGTGRKIKPHDYSELVDLPDPYSTDDEQSRFHSSKIRPLTDGDEDE